MNHTDPEDSKAFLDEIKKSESARSEAATDRIVDGLLRASAAMNAADKPNTAAEVLKRIRTEPDNVIALPDGREQGDSLSRTTLIRSFTVVAASLLLIAGLWWLSENLTIRPLATLEAYGPVTIHRGDRAVPVTATARLYNRDTIETRQGARAIVRYTNERTYMNLRSESRLTVNRRGGAKQLLLQSGSLIADVAPQPADRPMIVATPQASVLVAGTSFRLKSDTSGSLLEVTDGKVCMTRLSDQHTLEVPAGCTLALEGSRTPTLLPIGQVVLGHLRNDQMTEPDKSVKMARALAVNTLTYEMALNGAKPPDRLKQAVATAHKAGLRFFAKVDIQGGRALNLEQAELIRLLQNRLAAFVEEYDLDGVYFINAATGRDESQVVNLLNPVYQYMNETQPGTALVIGYPSDSNT
jgi:ferric-dicitrate binding protein FerR (iron transport regulator)